MSHWPFSSTSGSCASCPAVLAAYPSPLPALPEEQIEPARNFITEAVIGSLPRALSAVERESISASVPLSSTLRMLSSLPSDKVAARGPEGRALRRRALKGAVLVFVAAGYSGGRGGASNF